MTQKTPKRGQQVTVLGLGAIGATVARTLLESGMKVTVWNRTQSKAASLAEAGAVVAISPAEAIAASPLVISCLWDYAFTDEVFGQDGVEAALDGKVFVQLSTGSSEEAKRQGNWVEARGASFLAGGVMCFPRAIGAEETIILYAGDPEVFKKHADLLANLAPAQQHVGNRPGDAAPAYLALWSFYFSGMGGFLDGLAMLSAHDLAKENVKALVAPMANKLVDGMFDLMGRLDSHNFAGDQTTVSSMQGGLGDTCDQIRKAGVEPLMLEAFVRRLAIAPAHGRGDEDIAAVADLLMSQASSIDGRLELNRRQS